MPIRKRHHPITHPDPRIVQPPVNSALRDKRTGAPRAAKRTRQQVEKLSNGAKHIWQSIALKTIFVQN